MTTRLIAITLLMVALFALFACATPTAAPTAAPPTQASTAVTSVPAASTAAQPYGLKPGKPYNGTKIRFKICCPGTAQFEAWKVRASEFTNLTGIEVEFTFDAWSGYREKIMTESIAGTGSFDVVSWTDSWGPSLMNYLLPLAPRIASGGLDMTDYPRAYLDDCTYNGIVYGAPVRSHVYLLFYRQDVFDKLGLKPPTTWDELTEAAKKIKENTSMPAMVLNFAKEATDQNLNPWVPFLRGNGADFFDKNWKPAFNTPEGIAATKYYIDLLNYSVPASKVYTEQEAANSFAKGEAAMTLMWSWHYEQFVNSTLAVPDVVKNVRFVQVPRSAGKDAQSFAMSFCNGISAFSRKQDAAWEFIKWVNSADLEKAVVLDQSNPKTTTVVTSHQSVMLDPKVNALYNNLHQVMAGAVKNSSIRPLIPEWPEVLAVLTTAMNQMGSGAPVQATMDKAAQDVQDLMKRSGYYK